MNGIDRLNLYDQALDQWGLPLQLGMLVEECAEVIQAVNKFQRKGNQESIDNLAEEIADVEIMLEQIKRALRLDQQSMDHKTKKLNRLKEMLE